MRSADRPRPRGRLAALVHAVVALFSPLGLTGCVVGPAFGALGLCSEQEPDIAVTITSPQDGATFDGVPVRIEFELSENPDGVPVEEWLLGLGRVDVPAGELRGALEGIPTSGFNDPITGEPQPLPTGTYEVQIVASSLHDREDRVTIEWVAPWRVAGAQVCSPHLLACAELSEQEALAGRIAVTPRVLQDPERLVGAALELDGVELASSTTPPFTLEVDLDELPDGAGTLTVVVQRDDGRPATLAHDLALASCARLPVTSERYVIYADDATRYQATLDLTASDLLDATSRTWVGGDGELHRLFHDGDQTVYAGYMEGATWLYAFDVAAATLSPTIVAELPGSGGVSGIARAADGAMLVTTGFPHFSPAGKQLYRVAGGIVTEVTTSPLGPNDVLVDDDGTLLVPAGDTLWRLTVVDGVEVARVAVLSRPGRELTRVALDELGRLYVVAVDPDPFAGVGGEVLRYATPTSAPEELHADPLWRLTPTGGATIPPPSISFLRAPAHCHGLSLDGMGSFPGPNHVLVDVGEVRGRP